MISLGKVGARGGLAKSDIIDTHVSTLWMLQPSTTAHIPPLHEYASATVCSPPFNAPARMQQLRLATSICTLLAEISHGGYRTSPRGVSI